MPENKTNQFKKYTKETLFYILTIAFAYALCTDINKKFSSLFSSEPQAKEQNATKIHTAATDSIIKNAVNTARNNGR